MNPETDWQVLIYVGKIDEVIVSTNCKVSDFSLTLMGIEEVTIATKQ